MRIGMSRLNLYLSHPSSPLFADYSAQIEEHIGVLSPMHIHVCFRADIDIRIYQKLNRHSCDNIL